ncbi:MAG: FAD-dependent oxidoreductase [Pseudomonadota bacterium]
MSDRRVDTAVIGGGLMGLSVALAEARAGRSVVVLEAERVGRQASSASAGGVRSLNRDPAEIALSREALGLWRTLHADLGQDVGFKASGQIRVAEDADAYDRLAARAALTKSLGHTHEELIGANALRDLEPAVASHTVGALVVRDDGFADPLKAVRAYGAAARAAGVQIREGGAVKGLRRVAGGIAVEWDGEAVEAAAVVNTAGAWGADLAASVGEPVQMETAALQMSVTERVAPFVRAVVGTEGRKLSLKQSAAGHVIIGGGHRGAVAQKARHGAPIAARVAQNVATAAHLFPALKTARIARSWVGLEGWTADSLPVIGPSETLPGLVHVFGFSGHGFALVPLIGPLIADIIAGKEPDTRLQPFAPARFCKTQSEPMNA